MALKRLETRPIFSYLRYCVMESVKQPEYFDTRKADRKLHAI